MRFSVRKCDEQLSISSKSCRLLQSGNKTTKGKRTHSHWLTSNLLAWAPDPTYVGAMKNFVAKSAFVLGLSLTALISSAQAGERPIVVELFTSQGCSSCPPADAFLNDLAKREDVLALSLPVNIWDYLGWRDTLAKQAFTDRQRAYVQNLGGRSVYTPQMVIDGVEDAVGSRQGHVNSAIDLRREMKKEDVSIDFVAEGDIIRLNVGALATNQEATLWLVRYVKETPVVIERGENAGTTITYSNVVREMVPVGMWKGDAISLTMPKSDLVGQSYDGCAAILQVGGNGPILGAARLDMNRL